MQIESKTHWSWESCFKSSISRGSSPALLRHHLHFRLDAWLPDSDVLWLEIKTNAKCFAYAAQMILQFKMIGVRCPCVETLQFGRAIPSIWCVKNLTCILEHVVYGPCGLFNAPQTYFQSVVHLSNSVGPRKMMERAEFGSWSLNLTRAMQRLGFQRSPLTQTHNILFYLTDRCATDVVPYIYIFYPLFLCNSQF